MYEVWKMTEKGWRVLLVGYDTAAGAMSAAGQYLRQNAGEIEVGVWRQEYDGVFAFVVSYRRRPEFHTV